MKDMTVKELIVKCGVGWNDFKAELLRRFEALQERLDIACHVKADDKVKFDFKILDKIGRLETENESLKCCGNCKKHDEPECPHWKVDYDCGAYYPDCNYYCNDWQSDGLAREEREGK